jgi:hypothetical protein
LAFGVSVLASDEHSNGRECVYCSALSDAVALATTINPHTSKQAMAERPFRIHFNRYTFG